MPKHMPITVITATHTPKIPTKSFINTKVTLHWPVESSPSLPDDVRDRFRSKYEQRINKNGELVIYSQRYRDQGRNTDDCLDKLREMLLASNLLADHLMKEMS